MKGILRSEITELNNINLIDYLLETDKDNYRKRDNGTMTYKPQDSLVIYTDHSYNFGTTLHPYKDVIGTIREIYGYDFMTAVNKLRTYRDKHQEIDDNGAVAVPKYDLFEN